MKKRILALLLAAVMLLPTLTACSEGTENNAQPAEPSGSDTVAAGEETTAETEEELSEEEARLAIPDNLPAQKFDGQEFRILTQEAKEFQFVADELTGEATSDAVYNRNLQIEERFDTKITTILTAYPQVEITTLVTSGDDACEIVEHHQYVASEPISKGAYLNWNDIPYIDQDQPWWNQLSNDGATINGKLFCIMGDLSITALTYTFAQFFNMDLMQNYGYAPSDLYGLVFEGQWTLDKFIEITGNIYEDTNGDGQKSVGDKFGYGFWVYHGTDVWVDAIGEHLTEYDPETNTISVTLGTEKVYNALEKIINHLVNNNGAYHFMEESTGMAQNVAGNVGIMQLMFESAFQELRDVDYSYGILPYPKYDETQDAYYTLSMDQFSVFGVPKTVPEDRYAFLGIVMEALNAESYKTVYPEYYNTALKNKYSEDPETARIVDLIMEGRLCEFAFQFGTYLANLPYMFRYQIFNKDINLASALQRQTK
ncbi:MAG: hypothetical protein ACI4V1_03320, partial [Eubacteriales bacterium]